MTHHYVNDKESFFARDKKDFIAGTLAGICQTVAGQPFDTIKVRLQVSSHSKYTGPFDCLTKTVKIEGISGLYKGMLTPLLFSAVKTPVELATWGYFKKLIFSIKGKK